MDLVQLKYFRAVAKTGNVSKAAEMLFVTQPNLSKSIARLEEELGVPVFDHRKGKITLNDYGRVFLSSVEAAFEELENGKQTIRRMYEDNQHVLRLGCCVDDFLSDMLHSFAEKYPDVGIRQISCSYHTVAERIMDRSADIIITNGPSDNDGIHYMELGRQEYVLLLSAKHPLAGKQAVYLKDLQEEKFICDSSRMNLTKLQALCRARGFEPHVAYEVESSALIFRLLELNSGIAFMPIAQVLKIQRMFAHNKDRICMIKIKDDIPRASIGLAYHRSFAFTYAANCLLKHVQNFFQEEECELQELRDG